jgi:hypothetical protein
MQQLKDLARQHIDIAKTTFGIEFGFDEQSIQKQDELIKQGWNGTVPANLETPVTLFGAYLGEAIIHNLGGNWIQSNGSWVVELTAKDGASVKANVFAKVHKRFVNGEGDSLAYFYQGIKKAINNELLPP